MSLNIPCKACKQRQNNANKLQSCPRLATEGAEASEASAEVPVALKCRSDGRFVRTRPASRIPCERDRQACLLLLGAKQGNAQKQNVQDGLLTDEKAEGTTSP